jgi:prepilin-type N-terminal cleavage/methylation domain-containing protein
MKIKLLQNQKGFTLIELMVAMTIIAILAVIGLVIFSQVQQTARDTARKGDIDAIATALETRYNTTPGQYCEDAEAGDYCPIEASWFAGGEIPTDPQSGNPYSDTIPYATDANAEPFDGFTICATLEADGTYCRSNQQ